MKEEITIQSSTATADGQGGHTILWADVATEWAKVTELSYDRILLDGGIKFNKACQFEMRERGDTYTMGGLYRIWWGGRVYTVYSVVTNDSRTTMSAYCVDL